MKTKMECSDKWPVNYEVAFSEGLNRYIVTWRCPVFPEITATYVLTDDTYEDRYGDLKLKPKIERLLYTNYIQIIKEKTAELEAKRKEADRVTEL